MSSNQFAGFEIYVDTHEPKGLVDLFKTTKIKKLEDVQIPVIQKLLECGDIAIVFNGHIIAVIERKTWKDLASSIKDGRIDNEEKLEKAKTDHNCHLYYLIEGRMRMQDTNKVARMPYSSLLAFLDHRAMNGYIIIQSKTWQDTATRVLQLLRAYSTRKDILDPLKTAKGGGIEELKAPEITDDRIKAELWRTLPGVSYTWASIISSRLSLAKLIRGELEEKELADIKNDAGRRFGPAKSKKIRGLDTGARDKKILSAIRGITPRTADTLLESGKSLNNILGLEKKVIAEWTREREHGIGLTPKPRKIGPKMAENILSLNNY